MSKVNRFKTVSTNVKVKQKFSNFIVRNSDPSIAIDRIVAFARHYYILISSDLDEYENGYLSMKRVVGVTMFKLLVTLTTIRYFISSVFSGKSVLIFMSDSNYLLGDQKMISILMSMSSAIVLSIGLVIQFQEMNRSLSLLTFFNGYKNKRIVQLNAMNSRRLAVRANLMAKYVIKQAFWPLVITTTALFFGASLMAYMDEDSGFVLISVLFWGVILFIFLIQVFAMASVGFVASTLSTLYLKYKFSEINTKIMSSVKHHNQSLMMRAITEHNSVSEQTKQLNGFFSLIILMLYFFVTPPLMILIYIIHANNTAIFTRFVASFVFLFMFLIVFSINLLSSLISQTAHKSLPLLFAFILENKLSITKSFKIIAFIEKLSGPDIGFYCWDLFPMNNNQFYEYVANCAATYFLILEILMKY